VVALAVGGGLGCPIGKIQDFTALDHMLGDNPRNRRDMAVPWPGSTVRVAVLA